ncbi:MAG: sensor histidine kinase [Clostridiales bacterium]|nr:sensor histidine kinase [Clostridiales bacterium]
MNKYWRITFFILLFEILLLIGANFLMLGSLRKDSGKMYRIEIERASHEMEAGASAEDMVRKYDTLSRISLFDAKEVVNRDYNVIEINGQLYRFEYQVKKDLRPLLFLNIGMGLMLLLSAIVLIYVGRKILRPFHQMSNLSVELARGNLTAPVKAEKSKFFGKFLWGINMLRDNLESNKERELQLQKEKKTLILSLSHDIKTPLSAIKLYSRALKEDLYDTKEKREAAIDGIANNTEEIEKYVSDIVTASKEDFLNLEVMVSEFYLREVMTKIETLYTEKFASLHTRFSISEYDDVLISGDAARLEEVLQNTLENAIKYGDGKEVSISFSDEEDCRLISVRNSGCSIKEEELTHLFESFYRGSNSEKVNGSGLGLYIARTLMRMMDGDIYAEIKENDFIITVVARKA